ncbi:class I SAM-dependent methyltransferase [Halopseudomonas sp.]|uniref:class I SAM-dependent methyltransferase n=1 Tax=Halopseudomonas sp. TaxID=2901191 RepID=UPI003568C5E8
MSDHHNPPRSIEAQPAADANASAPLKPDHNLSVLARQTLAHYEQNAEDFREGTRDHDVSQNITTLLQHIQAPAPFHILDVGCGPGRDLRTFTRLGHVAVGLDGCGRFVEMAREDSGCDVWLQDFLALDLPVERFDGVFANASLFHIPSRALSHALQQLHHTLKPGGVLLSSNPRGDDQEGWAGDRYAAYYQLETWRSFMQAAGFTEIEHYYRPAGLPQNQQPWLASVWRRS